ncbi:MAG: hypothetical protein ABSG15_01050 [FCB group bacterium]|jgi:hypothetical protein
MGTAIFKAGLIFLATASLAYLGYKKRLIKVKVPKKLINQKPYYIEPDKINFC